MNENPNPPIHRRPPPTATAGGGKIKFAIFSSGRRPSRWPCFCISAWIISTDALTHESTDDAFIAGHIVSIAPRIDGQVSAVHVLDNQMVRSNDLLVEIDPSDYAITVAQKQAAESQDANVKTIVAGVRIDARQGRHRRGQRAQGAGRCRREPASAKARRR
jgi:multidrug resistance efflux pump